MKSKKLLAFIIAMVFVVSVCPFAYAEDEIPLTYEDVTGSQAPTAIVSDLSLPAGYEWSSDSEAITIGEEAGDVIPATVTRALREDKAVTLTATKDGATKEFELTVKAKTAQVIAASSYANGENTAFTNEVDYDKDGVTGSVVQEADGNYCFRYDYDNQSDGFYDRYRLTDEQLTKANSAEILNIEFDFKYDQTHIVDLKIAFNNKAYGIIRLNKKNLYLIQATKETSYGTDWNHLSLAVNTYEATVTATLNGTLIGTANIVSDSDLNTYLTNRIDGGLTYIEFQKGEGSVDSSDFYIDNFVLSAEFPEELSAEEKREYFDSLEWSDLSDEKAGAVTAFEKTFPTAGGAISWSSDNAAISFADKSVSTESNTATLGKTATVTRPAGKLNTNAVITATYENGDDNAVKKFYVSVLPEDYITDFNSSTSVAQILADFEEGTDGSKITLVEGMTYISAGVSAWAVGSGETAADVAYALDDERGMTAKISGAGAKARICTGGSADIQNSATTGLDIKLKPGETSGSGVKIVLWSGIQNYIIQVYDGKIGINTSGSAAKWYTVDTSDWFRIDVDTNLVSRTSDFYINGVKLNDEPVVYSPWQSANTSNSPAVRYVNFEVVGSAECFVDNLSVSCATNKDLTLAEAGVIWAKLYKDGITVTESTQLPAYGPEYDKCMNLSTNEILTWEKIEGVNTITDRTPMEGATLTWSENGSTVTEIGATKPYVHSYTLTATSGSETATTTINITEAPVVISVDGNGKVTVDGNKEGGTLIVATMDDNKLTDVTTYTEFDNISVADIPSYKLIFIDSFANLAPLAFEISK